MGRSISESSPTIKKAEEKILSILSKKADFVRSRKGASILLASAALVGSIFIASNLSVVKVTDGEQSSKVVATKNKSSERVIRLPQATINDLRALRAFDMKVIDGGKEKTISAVSGSVGEALENAGIALPQGEDVINVSLESEAEENMVVKIDRVKYVTETKTKTVKFKTVTKKDKTLDSGKTKVSVEGVNGEKQVTTTKKYVNGKLKDTKVTEKVTKKAVDKVVLKGTKAKPAEKKTTVKSVTTVNSDSKTITVNGKEISYSRVLTGQGTAYTAPRGSLTSTGKTVKVGRVAVDPRKIPYGTKLYIVSADGRYTYGYAVAADTGGALRSGRVLVDLFYNTERECNNFGRRQVKVYILD